MVATSERHPLTPRQQQILDLIRRHTREHGYPPTVRWIGEQTGIKSPNGVTCHLKALARKGCITHEPKTARGIAIPGESPMDVLRRVARDIGFDSLSGETRAAVAELVGNQCASV